MDWAGVGNTIGTFLGNALTLAGEVLTGFDWGALVSGLWTALNAVIDKLPGEIKTIGAALLAWKLPSAFMSSLDTVLTKLGLINGMSAAVSIGVVLTITGIALEANAIKDAIKTGLDGLNFTEIVVGGLMTSGGAALLGSKLATWISTAFAGSKVATAIATAATNLGVGTAGAAGAAIAAGVGGIIAGLPAMFVGIYDSITKEVNWLNTALTAAGGAAAGAGIAAICTAAGTAISPGIGTLIGLAVGLVAEGIILIVQKWDSVVAFFKGIGEWFATDFAGFFVDAWNAITNIDWGKIGYDIGYACGSVVKWFETDFVEFFKAIGNWFATDFVDFFKGVGEWFATDFLDFFRAIGDWFATDFVNFFKEIPNWEIWKAEYWQKLGKNIVDGLVEGWNAIWTAIKDFCRNFIQGFKDALGIHSPSTVFAEIGRFLIEGLLKGIKAMWQSIAAFFTNAVAELTNLLNSCWQGIISGAQSAWSSVKNTVTNAWSGIKSGVSSAWNSVKSTVSSVGSSIKSSVSSAWNSVKSATSSAWNSVKSSVTNTFTGIKNSAATWGKDLCDNMANGISKAKSTVESAVKSVASQIKSFLGFSEPEAGPLSNFHTYMPDMIDLMTTGIKSNQGKVIGAVAGMASAISNEIQNGEYGMGDVKVGTAAVTGMDSVLTSFADKVENSFTLLLDRLAAIAERVSYTTPAVATGVLPYKVAATAASGGGVGTTEAPLDTIKQAVAEVLGDFISSNVAGHEATVAVLQQILEAVLGIEIGPETVAEMVNGYNRKMSIVRGRT